MNYYEVEFQNKTIEYWQALSDSALITKMRILKELGHSPMKSFTNRSDDWREYPDDDGKGNPIK